MNERECFSRSLQVVWFAVQTSQLYPNDQPYLLCLGLLLVPGWALWPQEGHWWGRKLREGGRGWPLGAAPAEPAFDSAALLLTIQRVFHLLLSSVPNLYFCASPGGCLLLQCWSPGTTDPKQLQMVLSSSFGANCMYIFFRFNIQIQLIYIYISLLAKVKIQPCIFQSNCLYLGLHWSNKTRESNQSCCWCSTFVSKSAVTLFLLSIIFVPVLWMWSCLFLLQGGQCQFSYAVTFSEILSCWATAILPRPTKCS